MLSHEDNVLPIADRTRERLGSSDAAIIATRQVLLKAVKSFKEGKQPPALDPNSHHVRAASVGLPEGVPFQIGAKELLVSPLKKGDKVAN